MPQQLFDGQGREIKQIVLESITLADGKVLTLPASLTAAGRDVANTFTQEQTFNQPIQHANQTLSYRENGDNWAAQVFLTGITLSSGSTTTIDTGIDLTTYGSETRGGYKAFGIILGDDPNSNAHSAVFECSFRYASGSASSQRGSFLQATLTSFFNAITLDSNGTDIQIKVTSTATVNLVETCLWFVLSKQNL